MRRIAVRSRPCWTAAVGRGQILPHQLFCPVLCRDWVFFLCFHLFRLFFQHQPVCLDSLVDALKIRFRQQTAQSIHVHLLQVGSQALHLALQGLYLRNDNFVFLRRVHLVAIHGLAADELSLALLIPLHRLDLLGNILGVHIVHNGPERGLHAGVDAVQQKDIAHPLFREIPLHVVASHDVIPPQTGQVLGDDHVDLFGLDVFDHPPEGRPIEAGAAEPIVDIGVENGQPMLPGKLIQQRLLVGNT